MDNIRVCPTAAALAIAVAQEIAAIAVACIAHQGRFTLCLSGGGPPRAYHALLAQAEIGARIDWGRVHVFWGDERAVPPEHADSNYGMARDSLLSRVSVPAWHVHRILGERGAAAAADLYDAELLAFFGSAGPAFDLVLLGMGDDGHTASLFPGSPALAEATRMAVAVEHNVPPPPLVPRVTLTPVMLNRAAQAWVVVSGAGKAARVREALTDAADLPVNAIHPAGSPALWWLDADAAALLFTQDTNI